MPITLSGNGNVISRTQIATCIMPEVITISATFFSQQIVLECKITVAEGGDQITIKFIFQIGELHHLPITRSDVFPFPSSLLSPWLSLDRSARRGKDLKRYKRHVVDTDLSILTEHLAPWQTGLANIKSSTQIQMTEAQGLVGFLK